MVFPGDLTERRVGGNEERAGQELGYRETQDDRK